MSSTVDTDHEFCCADLLVGLQDAKADANRPHVHICHFTRIDTVTFCNDLEGKNLDTFSNELDVDLTWDEWSRKFHDILNPVCYHSFIVIIYM